MCLFKSNLLVERLGTLLKDIYQNTKKAAKLKLLMAMGLLEVYAEANRTCTRTLPLNEIEALYISAHSGFKLSSKDDPKAPQPDKDLIALYWRLLLRLEELEPDCSEQVQNLIERVWSNSGAEHYFLLLEVTVANKTLVTNTAGAELRRNFLLNTLSVMKLWQAFPTELDRIRQGCDQSTGVFLDKLRPHEVQ